MKTLIFQFHFIDVALSLCVSDDGVNGHFRKVTVWGRKDSIVYRHSPCSWRWTTMQQVLEYALDRAEYIVESARQRPARRRNSSGGRKSLYQKLYELYIEECEKEPELKNLRRNVNLLEKLVSQESVSCLVVNLYPGNEGYSLMLRGKNGSDSETIRLPYEEGELLEYLDAEELPPILVDLLEKSQVNIFHCGCVIVEVRDYRQSGNTKMPTYQSRHILLRPTMQTLICDVHAMTSDHHKWTQDDKLQLEKNEHSLYETVFQEALSSCSEQAAGALPYAHATTATTLRLPAEEEGEEPAPVIDLKISKIGNCVDMWKQSNCQLTVPKEIDVEKYAVVERSLQLEDSQPNTVIWPAEEVIDDYTFECEVGGQAQRTKVSIYQSMGDPLVYGKIYCAKEPKAEEDSTDLKLIHPPFLIGSKIDADRFLNQYKGVYEKDLKCQVKMSHNSGTVAQGPPSPNKDGQKPVSEQEALHGAGPGGPAVAGRPLPHGLHTEIRDPQAIHPHSYKHAVLHTAPRRLPLRSSLVDPYPFGPPHASEPVAAPLLPPFAQQQLALSQQLPVMTIPLPAMGTSITTGSTSPQVMANPAGLNFINVVSSVCSPQTLMSGSSPMLGAGLNLSGILPPAGLMSTMQSAAQTGSPFGLNSSAGLRPLNLCRYDSVPVTEPVGHLQPSAAGEMGDQLDLTLGNQQTAVINLGVGGFMSPQAAVAILAAPNATAANGYGSSGPSGGSTTATYHQPTRSKRKRSLPQPLQKS
ncbi:hypothetical protein KUCAC02_003310 [Chaenocephalus aceratus]|uniref:Uncharacterized protein n=1 Tax=Chaenocephalus aceratus TaxID=36190 RepID=A0ACB9WKA5_CHAAC|nr:hypothetical protein KUCAC02_003310 [Chaenocephalus aceratus]